MTKHQNSVRLARRGILLGCCIAAALPAGAFAQSENGGVADIIVTAQRREQSLQDVPIAVTAVSQATLEANRITSVTDLAVSTPNLEVRSAAGGANIPVFVMRGAVSYGSVAGSDKSVSLYLDGVYIGSSQGSAFELPDLERIEVLRGPQGTLFGRNASAGAVSIVTRDPSGEFSARQVFTVGNYNQFRSSTRVELPAFGPFAASISYTHDERDGDMKNLGAGQVWDRTGFEHLGVQKSPKRLGDKNSESVFFALKFQPEGSNFRSVYKFDWMENHFTPEGEALTAFTPGALGANGLPLAIAYAQSPGAGKLDGANRPDAVNNFFTTPGYQRVYGHNLTSTLQASDSLTIKNIFGYRRSFIVSVSDLTGAGSLVTTPAVAAQLETNSRLPAGSLSSLIGSPYVAGGSATLSKSKQFSDELQLNYDSELLTLTTGLMWFNVKTETGAPDGLLGPSTILSPVRGGVPGRNSRNLSFITMESFAGYAQAEFHVTPQLDIIGGYRLTHDIKNGVTWIRNTPYGFSYKDTRASYMGTVNYRPNNDILVYGKYATGYVSGGSVSGIDFKPEIATSWEAGAKADLFNRMLRLNLALFKTKYQDLQAVSGGTFLVPPRPELGTLIINDGDLKTKGFEVEATLVPVRGVTLSASGGYTKAEASNSNAALGLNRNLTLRPKWTSNVSAQYESDPLFGDTSFVIRADGAWRSKVRTVGQNGLSADYNSILYSPKGWVVNGRVGLQNVNLGGAKADITLWGRNIFDQDRPMFPIYFAFLGSTSYERARTYGVDVAFKL